MNVNLVVPLLRSIVLLTALVSANWEDVREILQSENGASLSFDTSVITSQKCREDLQFWSSSLQRFIGAVQLQCAQNDTECKDTKTQIATETLFAAQQYDSFGRVPANILNMNNKWQGSWEECIHVATPARTDYKTHFCWISLHTPITLQTLNKSAFSEEACSSSTPFMTQWSVCMPRSCENQDISALFRTMNNSTQGTILFCDSLCQLPGPPKKDGGFWVFIAICAITLFLLVLSTVIDYISDSEKSCWKRFRSGTGMKCLLTFSVYTNGAEILDTTKRPGQIYCLNSLRVFSVTWVIVGHVLVHFLDADDLVKLFEQNNYFFNLPFTNAFFAVDSYLFIGGLVLAYVFIKEMEENPAKMRSLAYWVRFIVHRIIRLGPPYFLTLGLTIVMFDFLTVGPMEKTTVETMAGCRKTWWRNILFINNLWDVQNMCMAHSWYLALDMQIHIFIPLVLVPLFFSLLSGLFSAALSFVLSSALNYWAFYRFDSPASLTVLTIPDIPSAEGAGVNFQMYLYFAPWIRFTPYVIGVFTGYFLYKTEGKRLELHPVYAILLWIGSVAIGVGCVYGLYDYLKGQYLSVFERATYYNFSRIFWSVALAWVVIACERNWAGPAKNFLELSFWGPLGHLSYCAFLNHYLLSAVLFGSFRQPAHYVSPFYMYVNKSISVIVLSYVTSFIWCCAFEIPFIKLEKIVTGAFCSSSATRRSKQADNEFDGNGETVGQPGKQHSAPNDVVAKRSGERYESKNYASCNDEEVRRRRMEK